MILKIKRLNAAAVIPAKAHPTGAGFDLTATSRTIDELGNIVYGTGLAFEIPTGYVGLVFPRSSISKQDVLLSNAVGVIDSGYRGEVLMKFRPSPLARDTDPAEEGKHGYYYHGEGSDYKIGDRIGQLIIIPLPEIEIEEADELSDTDRGTGGYGSTGA